MENERGIREVRRKGGDTKPAEEEREARSDFKKPKKDKRQNGKKRRRV
jgi:hypothetical protein